MRYLQSKIKVGLIGFGRMGRFFLEAFQADDRYRVAYICDVNETCRNIAREKAPTAIITDSEEDIYNDESVSLVALCAYADSRKSQIERALRAGKHVIAEKPIADTPEDEQALVALSESCGTFCTVNMYLRNSWYYQELKRIIDSGEIGELAILRICHMTPGLAPGEGHESEGPSFHDCGMHYVDVARWLAGGNYKTWHAQAIRMWSYKDPWWLQCHGTFDNGVVFDITQGFVYGQLSKDQTHNSYADIIGTKGIVRMTHDFQTARIELRGVTKTEVIEHPYGGKNIPQLIAKMADSIGKNERNALMPTFADSAYASDISMRFLEDAARHDMPPKGSLETLEEIRERRRHMKNGYGLLPHNQEN
ncbi:MAG: Gfo/Idh/MocA family oxidoreductase [Prevotella sp.]|nr:Gfo/Idh/MocA family oxidoreductase [Prevotella sp.]